MGPSRSEEGSQLGTSIEKTERQVPAGRQASVVGGIGGLFTGRWPLRPRFLKGAKGRKTKKHAPLSYASEWSLCAPTPDSERHAGGIKLQQTFVPA